MLYFCSLAAVVFKDTALVVNPVSSRRLGNTHIPQDVRSVNEVNIDTLHA